MSAATATAVETFGDRLVLPDGRVLGYAVYGDEDGTPLLFLSGTPSSRVMGERFGERVAAAGVRVVVPERPGMGISSPQPGRGVLDYVDDVAALADELDLDSFPIVGWSAGGPYALAYAARSPDRVTRVGLMDCPAPWDEIGPAPGAGVVGRLKHRSRGSYLVNLASTVLTRVFTTDPARLDGFATRLPDPDRQALAEDWFREAVAAYMADAFRQGLRGPARDLHLVYEEWEFSPDEVAVPVDIWHAVADEIIPFRHGEYLAGRLPDAAFHAVADEGHFSIFADRLEEIFTATLAPAEADD